MVNWLKVRTKVSVERPLLEPSAKKCWVQSSTSYTKDRTHFQRVAKRSHRSQSASRLLREAFITPIASRRGFSLSTAARGLLSCSHFRLRPRLGHDDEVHQASLITRELPCRAFPSLFEKKSRVSARLEGDYLLCSHPSAQNSILGADSVEPSVNLPLYSTVIASW